MARFDRGGPEGRTSPSSSADILSCWKDAARLPALVGATSDAPVWIFYEGPPTANGIPGVHHVEPRTFKDVYPRFKTMTGHLVHRKAGWDCHGLPVELEVEKEIGTTGKRDIEAFGVAAFNQLCRASVQRYVGEFARLTERIGYWIDMDEAYWTMSTEYIECVWWSLQQLHERGLLVEADKVTAYCPRCGTALSDAEVAHGLPRRSRTPACSSGSRSWSSSTPDLVGASLAGLDHHAVDPSLERRASRWARPMRRTSSSSGTANDSILGAALAGARARRGLGGARDGARRRPGGCPVRAAVPERARGPPRRGGDFVTMDDGTGIVHLAPAFGPEDLAVGRAQGWPVLQAGGRRRTLHRPGARRSSAGCS